ncbi:C39 family peptidase [Cytobacillus sp. IB215665]|uniref:C39 family peptidase n=1 Tax=Cytobacillus sp. IB215665 TaxID=3097357 RepID=UPI002A1467EA|nr:C39 family peptidase [Cytobacillus sp. IB215665]MDX8367450.1 C39 family peptidase [Cytobacillus sp. IB215665]
MVFLFWLLIVIIIGYLLYLYKTQKKAWKTITSCILVLFILCIILLIKKLPVSTLREANHTSVEAQAPENDVEIIQNTMIKIKNSVLLQAPALSQLPELPRGCEVTALAMFLQYAGVVVDKMELAEEVAKDPTPYKKENGIISYGHPNNGFVGDMYSRNNRGYGVYVKPIKQLAEQYLPSKIIDLTDRDFKEIEMYLSIGSPVWVITNTTYQKLSNDKFEHWETPDGKIKITYFEHSVLITGYDSEFIYFNDPLTGEKNKKVPRDHFIAAWQQMGSQAITYME